MVAAIQQQYEKREIVGYQYSQADHERFTATMPDPHASDIAHRFGFTSQSRGKLVIPFVHILEMYPGSLPGPGQQRGDCTSHGNKNAGLGSHVLDVISGEPDEVTGKQESKVEICQLGIEQGVFSTEALYLHAGHSNRKGRNGYIDDGWNSFSASRVMTSKTGLVIRKNYPELGIDFTSYDPQNGGLFDGQQPPQSFIDATDNHLFRTATEVGLDPVGDMLASGFFMATDGGQSFSNVRDEFGVAKQTRDGWPHTMSFIGFDDRPGIVQRLRSRLILVLNSWRFWNKGPRDIFDSAKYVPERKRQLWIKLGIVNPETGNIMIPRGSFWARESDLRNRLNIAYSGHNGWAPRKLPDYLGGW